MACGESSTLSLRMLPANGIYTLIMFLPKEAYLNVGKLGVFRFPRGYYTYTGSALGVGASGLKGRILRHLRRRKRKFWHIDFLLAYEDTTLTSVVAAQTIIKLECKMNRYIKENGEGENPVPGFGASDCEQSCKSHLLYFKEDIKSKIATFYYKKMGIKPVTIDSQALRGPKLSNSP